MYLTSEILKFWRDNYIYTKILNLTEQQYTDAIFKKKFSAMLVYKKQNFIKKM
jgi:hypothetical protein